MANEFEEFQERLNGFKGHRKDLETNIESLTIENLTPDKAAETLAGKVKEFVASYLEADPNSVRGSQGALEYVPQWETLIRLAKKAKNPDGSYNTAKIAEELSEIVTQVAEGKVVQTLSSMNPTGNGREVIKGWANSLQSFNPTEHTPEELANEVKTSEMLQRVGRDVYQAYKGVEGSVKRVYENNL